MEQQETGREPGRLPEESQHETTMAWTQVVAMETEGEENRSKKNFQSSNMIK